MSGEEPRSPGPAGRPSWSHFRAALLAQGFHPSRRLGQNFLLDENLCAALVRDAGVAPGDRVLEVGAGVGFLTAHLAAAGAEVLAVEIDRRLFEIARGYLALRPEVELLRLDALEGKHRLAPELLERLPCSGSWKLVANLPYAISGPLLALVAELEQPPERISVLVQREFADRVLAPSGSPDRGPLSVKLQAVYRAERVREVPRELFWPRPKVESSVLRLDLRADRLPPARLAELDRLLAPLFQRRRQGLGRLLGELLGSREEALARLAAAGVGPRQRPGELELADFLALLPIPEAGA
jgi:16S rRNA (adenine1518-N6/adenine1519-N6)-dimethyltransferase